MFNTHVKIKIKKIIYINELRSIPTWKSFFKNFLVFSSILKYILMLSKQKKTLN